MVAGELEGFSRREFLVFAGSLTGSVVFAGCTGQQQATPTPVPGEQVPPLNVGGSSTVFPITDGGSQVWNGNPEPGSKFWNAGEYGIDTDKRVADYFAGLFGFEAGKGRNSPPFEVSVNLSHSGIGLTKLGKDLLDIADASAPVEAEKPSLSQEELDRYVDHVVAVDAQPIVVSRGTFDSGVRKISLAELKAIYKGEISNWQELGGPDRKIQVIGRAVGSGTDTSFRLNIFGNAQEPIPGVDIRKGQNQQVQTIVANSDNALAYLALSFVRPEEGVVPVSLETDKGTFSFGENLASKDYPLSRDLHCYTYEYTSKKEAAFLYMLLHNFGQESFVETSGYLELPEERQKQEIDKLP